MNVQLSDYCQMNNLSAISRREQVTFDEVVMMAALH